MDSNTMLGHPEPMETDSDDQEIFHNHLSSSFSCDSNQNGELCVDVFPFHNVSTPEMKQECPVFQMSINGTNKLTNQTKPLNIDSSLCVNSKETSDHVADKIDDDDDIGFNLFDDDQQSLKSNDDDDDVTQTESQCPLKPKVEENTDGTRKSILDEILKDTETKMNSGTSVSSSAGHSQEEEFCCICRDEHTNPVVLPKCSHKYCRDCIDHYFKIRPVCPECFVPYGIITGNQPDGTMNHSVNQRARLQGYDKPGAIVISYSFSDGTQNENHPKPGQPYYGTSRTAYLPDTPEGHKVLKLLKTAFDRRLVFTVGRSRTTGADDVVTWNDIHHKTCTAGGQENFGYPDPTYLRRVQEELAAVGVTEESIETKK